LLIVQCYQCKSADSDAAAIDLAKARSISASAGALAEIEADALGLGPSTPRASTRRGGGGQRGAGMLLIPLIGRG